MAINVRSQHANIFLVYFFSIVFVSSLLVTKKDAQTKYSYVQGYPKKFHKLLMIEGYFLQK